MQGVLGDGEALRPQRRPELLDAEQTARVAQQMPHEPSQTGDVAHRVAFDDVAQYRHVDVVAKELAPRRRVQPLRLGKAPGVEPVQQGAFEVRALAAGQGGGIVGAPPPLMAQRLFEAEGMHRHLPRPASERGCDLARQEGRRRSGDEHLGTLGIEEAPDEPLPPRHDLDLVEVPGHRRAVVRVGKPAVVLGQQQVEAGRVEVREALVLERDVRQSLAGGALRHALPAKLVQERRLAGAAHAGHDRDLAGKPHPAEDAARGELGQGFPHRVGELLAEDSPQPREIRLRHSGILSLCKG